MILFSNCHIYVLATAFFNISHLSFIFIKVMLNFRVLILFCLALFQPYTLETWRRRKIPWLNMLVYCSICIKLLTYQVTPFPCIGVKQSRFSWHHESFTIKSCRKGNRNFVVPVQIVILITLSLSSFTRYFKNMIQGPPDVVWCSDTVVGFYQIKYHPGVVFSYVVLKLQWCGLVVFLFTESPYLSLARSSVLHYDILYLLIIIDMKFSIFIYLNKLRN